MKKPVLAACLPVLLALLVFASGCLSHAGCSDAITRNCTKNGCGGTQTCVNGNWGGCVKTDVCCGGNCNTTEGNAMYPFGVVDPPAGNYPLVKELGVTNVRVGVPWGNIQDKTGKFLWTGCGQDQLGELGITLVFRLRLTEHERASTAPAAFRTRTTRRSASLCLP